LILKILATGPKPSGLSVYLANSAVGDWFSRVDFQRVGRETAIYKLRSTEQVIYM